MKMIASFLKENYKWLLSGIIPTTIAIIVTVLIYKNEQEKKNVVEPITYDITFNANGGSFVYGGTTTVQNFILGVPQQITVGAPTRDGFTFVRWNDAIDGSGKDFTSSFSAYASCVLYAVWSVKTYAITFNANGGSFVGGGTTTVQNFTHGASESITVGIPLRNDFTFVGWNDKKDGSGKNFTTTITATSGGVLYAIWSSEQDDIEYVLLNILGIAIAKEDVNSEKGFSWEVANNMCKNSILGGHKDWRLPTLDELMTIFQIKN